MKTASSIARFSSNSTLSIRRSRSTTALRTRRPWRAWQALWYATCASWQAAEESNQATARNRSGLT
jgi:hypothetical protein